MGEAVNNNDWDIALTNSASTVGVAALKTGVVL